MSEQINSDNAKQTVAEATSLGELCEVFNAYEDESWKLTDIVDMSSLPTFGGTEPEQTCGIWSWDETRLMVQDSGMQEFIIIDRPRSATVAEAAELLGVAYSTVTKHARALGIAKHAGRYLFSEADIEALRMSIAEAIPGRPRKNTEVQR